MPILAKFPSPSTYLPITCLLVVVGPALSAWIYGRLTLEQSTWGMSALSLMHGHSRWLPTDSQGNVVPPLFSWLLALSLAIPFPDKLPLLTLPSYLYAIACLIAIGGLSRLWFSSGTALWTCFLVAFNPLFLEQVRVGDPSLGVLFWSLLGLWVYAHHLIREEETFSAWTMVGGLSFFALLLSVGFFAFWLPVLGLVNFLLRDWERRERFSNTIRSTLAAPTMRAGLIVVAIGFGLATPWIMKSSFASGPFSPWATPVDLPHTRASSYGHLLAAMPATLVLALVGLWRSVRQILRGREEMDRATLPVVWTLVAALTVRSMQPTQIGLLLLLVPLNLLAVRTLLDVLYRRIPDGQLFWITLATVWVYLGTRLEAFSHLPSLLTDVPVGGGALPSGSAFWFSQLTAEKKLSLHLAIDLLVLVGLILYFLYRSSAIQDRYRRMLFGGFVAVVVVLATLPSLALIHQPLRRDDPWVRVCEQLAPLKDIDRIIYVGSQPPIVPLTFVVKCRFPDLPTETAVGRVELEAAFRQDGNRPLVLVTDPSQRLPKTTPITRDDLTVTLSQIYDSDEVIAYAPLSP